MACGKCARTSGCAICSAFVRARIGHEVLVGSFPGGPNPRSCLKLCCRCKSRFAEVLVNLDIRKLENHNPSNRQTDTLSHNCLRGPGGKDRGPCATGNVGCG